MWDLAAFEKWDPCKDTFQWDLGYMSLVQSRLKLDPEVIWQKIEPCLHQLKSGSSLTVQPELKPDQLSEQQQTPQLQALTLSEEQQHQLEHMAHPLSTLEPPPAEQAAVHEQLQPLELSEQQQQQLEHLAHSTNEVDPPLMEHAQQQQQQQQHLAHSANEVDPPLLEHARQQQRQDESNLFSNQPSEQTSEHASGHNILGAVTLGNLMPNTGASGEELELDGRSSEAAAEAAGLAAHLTSVQHDHGELPAVDLSAGHAADAGRNVQHTGSAAGASKSHHQHRHHASVEPGKHILHFLEGVKGLEVSGTESGHAAVPVGKTSGGSNHHRSLQAAHTSLQHDWQQLQ